MRLTNISIYVLSLASMLGLWSCSADEEVPGMGNTGKPVPLTITVSRDGAQTRTELYENAEGGLSDKWLEGDELKIYDGEGNEAGTLTLESGADKATAVFAGTLNSGTSGEYRLWYFGQPVEGRNPNLELTQDNKVKINLANQSFKSAKDLSALDIMSEKVNITVSDNVARVAESITMKPQLAMARFKLTGIDGKSGKLVITNPGNNEGMLDAKQLNLSNPASSEDIFSQTDGINVSIDGNGGDIYVAFAPSAYTLKFTFTTTDGDVYVYQFEKSTTLEAGKYYCSWTEGKDASGVEIPLQIDDSDNPGNINNWGGNHGSLGGVPSFVYASKSDDEAWYYNCRVFGEYGYKKTSTQRYNKINNGHLTSWIYNDGTEAKYFQWGRLLGFPSGVCYAACTMLSFAMDESKIKYPFGMSAYTDYSLFYNQDMDSRPCYAYTSAWSNGMDRQQAVNSSIIYLPGDDVDYLKSELRKLSWSERSGNPCPDGFRVPTKDELEVFVPSETFEKTLVEYKFVKGVRYAVRWEKVSATKVNVTTVRTDREDALTASDDIFKDAKQLELEANGMIYSDNSSAWFATSFSGWKLSYYWSSTMTENGQAWALEVGINGSNGNVSIDICPVELTAGCCVIPIRDNSAKATGFQPWFPIGY